MGIIGSMGLVVIGIMGIMGSMGLVMIGIMGIMGIMGAAGVKGSVRQPLMLPVGHVAWVGGC